MKSTLLILIAVILCSSCGTQEEYLPEETISKIAKLNVDLFKDVRIEAVRVKDGEMQVSKYQKELNGKRYTLPNYTVYTDEQILDSALFDVLEYAELHKIDNEQEAYSFVKKLSNALITEFQKLEGIYKVFSSSTQGEFIAFFPREDRVIIFCEDTNNVKSDFWEKKLESSTRYDNVWYYTSY